MLGAYWASISRPIHMIGLDPSQRDVKGTSDKGIVPIPEKIIRCSRNRPCRGCRQCECDVRLSRLIGKRTAHNLANSDTAYWCHWQVSCPVLSYIDMPTMCMIIYVEDDILHRHANLLRDLRYADTYLRFIRRLTLNAVNLVRHDDLMTGEPTICFPVRLNHPW